MFFASSFRVPEERGGGIACRDCYFSAITDIRGLDLSHEKGNWVVEIDGMRIVDQEGGHGQDDNIVTRQPTHEGREQKEGEKDTLSTSSSSLRDPECGILEYASHI